LAGLLYENLLSRSGICQQGLKYKAAHPSWDAGKQGFLLFGKL